MASLYLHIPFTSHLCPYDDIYAEERRGPYTSYVQALCREIEHYAHKYVAVEPMHTLYVGGGMPSLLAIDEFQRLLQHVYTNFEDPDLEETTVEVSPEHASSDYLSGLRSMGVDRLSLQLQSFFQSDLDTLETTFDATTAGTCLQEAHRAGFENISVDVALGIPGQSQVHWAAVLEQVVEASVPHISLVEVGNDTIPPQQEVHEEKYVFATEYLQENGYEHYEISHFAHPGYQSRHNPVYWSHGNVLGLGANAHSFWWKGLPAYRWNNIQHSRRYEALMQQRQVPIAHKEALSLDALAEEHIVLRLRTAEGLDMSYLEERYGIDLLTEKLDTLASLEESGYIEPIRNQRIRLTDRGKLLCNSVTAKLLPETIP